MSKELKRLVALSMIIGYLVTAVVFMLLVLQVNDAFDSAILPTMNNMMTMGIVSLPGMMTGQMLSGTFPLTAIKYQIGIMLAILGCTAITVVIFVTLGYKTFFTSSAALK